MSFSKLRRIHVIIIGALVCAIVAAGMYFVLIKKANEKLALETSRYDQYKDSGTVVNVQMAEQELVKARLEVADSQSKLERYMRTRMPNLNLTQRDTGMIALWHEQSEVLGPLLIRWIRQSGVSLASAITVPAPPSSPNDPVLDSSPITISIGQVTVQGSFKRLMDHIRKWNSCSRLVMIDSPTLSGQSPNLTCNYTMTVYIFPREPAGPQYAMWGVAGVSGGMMVPGGMPMPGPMPVPGGAQTSMPGTLPVPTGTGTSMPAMLSRPSTMGTSVPPR